MKKSTTRWLGLGVIVLAIGLTALIIYLVSTHREAGLMEICWENGVSYFDASKCSTDKVELTWPKNKIPLRVYIDPDLAMQPHIAAVKDAIMLWNLEVGQIFVTTQNKPTAHVVIRHGAVLSGRTDIGYTMFMCDEQKQASGALVVIVDLTSTFTTLLITTHELGHVLGLDHDKSERSIMYPFIKTADDGTFDGTFIPLPTEHDKKILRKLYLEK